MKALLILTAAVETMTGLGLMAVPAPIVSILLGGTLDAPVSVLVARIAGAAVLALALACWYARSDTHGPATAGILTAMLLYNVAVAVLLAYAGISLELFAIGLWPAVGLHLALALWCIACLGIKRSNAAADGDPPKHSIFPSSIFL